MALITQNLLTPRDKTKPRLVHSIISHLLIINIHKVLAVDKSVQPFCKVLNTHFVNPHGRNLGTVNLISSSRSTS